MKNIITMRLLLIISLLIPIMLSAQSGSEIIMFDLKIKKNKVTISNPKNISNHKGYDNQPSFHSDAPVLYYSSFNDDGRADIKSYDYKSGESVMITQTLEREYSPTLTPDKTSLSCIIQHDNGAQDLGKYPLDGGDPVVIINNLTVGYHAWADNSHVALFVLGEPNSLHYLRLPTKDDTVVANNIGRSLHKMPGERAISFVQKQSDNNWVIKKLNTEDLSISVIAKSLPGREDITWTADGKILSSDGSKLFFLIPGKESKWIEVGVNSGHELLKGITRLAVNSNGYKLAVVVAE